MAAFQTGTPHTNLPTKLEISHKRGGLPASVQAFLRALFPAGPMLLNNVTMHLSVGHFGTARAKLLAPSSPILFIQRKSWTIAGQLFKASASHFAPAAPIWFSYRFTHQSFG